MGSGNFDMALPGTFISAVANHRIYERVFSMQSSPLSWVTKSTWSPQRRSHRRMLAGAMIALSRSFGSVGGSVAAYVCHRTSALPYYIDAAAMAVSLDCRMLVQCASCVMPMANRGRLNMR
jgi:cobalamin biosynthesis protein CobD/CbiB